MTVFLGRSRRRGLLFGFLEIVCLVLMLAILAPPTLAEDRAPTLSAPSTCTVGEIIDINGSAFLQGGIVRVDVTSPSGAITSLNVAADSEGSFVQGFVPQHAGLHSAVAYDQSGNVVSGSSFSASEM